jgi:hypothetical protein
VGGFTDFVSIDWWNHNRRLLRLYMRLKRGRLLLGRRVYVGFSGRCNSVSGAFTAITNRGEFIRPRLTARVHRYNYYVGWFTRTRDLKIPEIGG